MYITKRIWYVDCPKPEARPGQDDSWTHVDTFDSLKDAQKFCIDTWGLTKKQAEVFITAGEV